MSTKSVCQGCVSYFVREARSHGITLTLDEAVRLATEDDFAGDHKCDRIETGEGPACGCATHS